MKKIGIADTMFARADMGSLAEKTIKENRDGIKVIRYTVPGIKDLPIASRKLFDLGCDLVIALGMPGGKDIDKICAHEASTGLINAQLQVGKHIVEVFVHESETEDDKELAAIMKGRTIKHSLNAIDLLFHPENLTKRAGTGQRQGGKNAGVLTL